jgi:TonB-dependent starch-binding outer membrane protein SusC
MLKRSVLFILLLLANLSLIAQQTVTGTVKDSGGQPMSGVTVVVQGTTAGTLTGVDGKYTLPVPAGGTTLQFSFIGYATQDVAIAGKSVVDVTLAEALKGLDEVVVVGYGTLKKKLVTGATVQVKGDDIQKMSTISPMTALQGQTPGLSIIKSSGEPGAGFKVNIRGMGTIGNSTPLYVIDGVPGGDITYIASADIESIDILKDAASSAIYGSRGANGVILVTTKKGTKPASGFKANISYDASWGWQNLYKKLPMMQAKDYANIINESRVNSKLSPIDFSSDVLVDGVMTPMVPDWDKVLTGEFTGTDWLDQLTVKNAPITSNAINITGGSEMGTFSLGLSHSNQTGIIGNPVESNYDRYTFRLNTDFSVIKSKDKSFDVLKVGESMRYMYNTHRGIGTGNQYWNDVFSNIIADPLLPMYATSATDKSYPYHYAIPLSLQDGNPIASMIYNRGQNNSFNYALNGNFYFELQPVKNLVYRSTFGYNLNAGSYRSYVPVFTLSSTAFNLKDDVGQSMWAGYGWTFENTLTYNFRIGTDHAFTALIGQSAEKSGLGQSVGANNSGSLFSDFLHAYINNTPTVDANLTSISGSPWGIGGLMSYFGRVAYSYREKYMATAILRADASSNFMKGHRWGYFPSISAGWVISEENFFQNLKNSIDFLKLRASWGQNGNASISPFQYLATISFSNVNYFFGGDKSVVSTGGYPNILPNPDVTWETSDQLNVGFDARFLKNKLSAEFDVYSRKTMNWLINPSTLASYGTNAPYINGGDVSNKGVELALAWTDNRGDFNYSIGANMAYNKNEVLKIDNNEGVFHGDPNVLGQGTDELYRAQVGFPIGYFRGYKTLGVFQTEEAVKNYKNSGGIVIQPTATAGDLIFQDTNDDGVIDDNDKVMIGDPNPDIIVGLNLSLSFKGFDFSVLGNGAFGQQIARSWRRWADSPYNNYTTDIFSRWYGEGTSNKYPKLYYGASNNWQYVSDIFIENGDYFRLSNITLGYDFKKLFPTLPLAQARFFTTIQNAYTFTKYFGMDPEIGSNGGTGQSWAKGIDIGYYPSPRTVMLGVSVKF